MRNLRNVHHKVSQVAELLPLTALTWETNNSVICAFGPTKQDQVIELKRVTPRASGSLQNGQDEHLRIASWDAPCPLSELEVDRILDLHYLEQGSSICLVLAGGDVVVVRTQPFEGQDKIEIVGSVDAGIAAAAWSPDGELLAVITCADTLLFMTAEFENIAQTAFTPEDENLSQNVSVGWGKSETQFKGKRAKALRDPTIPEKVDEGKLSTFDEKEATISWRGDGAYVAVNTVHNDSRRMIRIFNREGTLESVSEPVDGLTGSMCWRPAGNLIACVQQLEEKANVLFFERNGLRHGQFALRPPPGKLKVELKRILLNWNPDSTVLAISFSDRVELWTMGNYHYYLKQSLYLPDASPEQTCRVLWHHEDALRMVVYEHLDHVEDMPRTSNLHWLEYILSLTTSSANPPTDTGLVAIIDGRTLRLTPLRRANIPPPMALHEHLLSEDILDVAIDRSSSKVAALQRCMVTLLRYESNEVRVEAPAVEKIFKLPNETSHSLVLRQVCFTGENEIYVLAADIISGADVLFHVSSGRTFRVHNISCIQRLFSSFGQEGLCIATEKGCFEIDPNALEDEQDTSQANVIEAKLLCSLPSIAPWITVVYHSHEIQPKQGESIVSVSAQALQKTVFSLNKFGHLHADERLLLRNCSSFQLSTTHLICSTANHLLKFAHLASAANIELPDDLPEADERCRNIERGATIVAAMPTTFAVVLQMPRGNLETIYPRALVLSGIRKFIESKDYKQAFLACRNQRVDMNILHDHAPQQFLHNVDLIIDQLGKVEHIDLLLSQLREEDVSKTLYRETLPQTTGTEKKAMQDPIVSDPLRNGSLSKVNVICKAFLSALQPRYSTNMQNVITANVCQVPPNIDAGLSVISELRKTDHELADSAVEHICFLADVNQVYDSALGLYDLQLALNVAEQSQKDPREYLPYIQALQKESEPRRCFIIDDQLRRYVKALKSLHTLDAFEELKAYIQRHELYSEAMELYRFDLDRHTLVLRLYAEFLRSRNRFDEAAIAFESVHDYSAACEAYRAANLWQESLYCALQVPLRPDEVSSIAKSLAESLVESKDFKASATIFYEYLSDVETAATLLCKGYEFSEAIRLVTLRGRPELVESVVESGIVESSATLTEFLSDCKSQLNAQVPRLKELRAIKLQDPLSFYEGMEPSDIPDNVSLAPTDTSTSGGSLFTRYTNQTGTINTATSRKTSKNRRREERKRARGKKGSIYEEEYLVSSIIRLVERVNDENENVQRTVQALFRRRMTERARAINAAMVEVTELCQASLEEVFGKADETAQTVGGDGAGAFRPTGPEGVPWDSADDVKNKQRPVLKPYVQSALLAKRK